MFAKKLKGELVSADSRQVYKYLDIGTGKEPGNESGIRNHESGEGYWIINEIKIWMYDVANPDQRFNLYEYVLKSREIIEKISNFGKLPILVGGTGLYIRSLLEGISDFGASENFLLRRELESLEISQIQEKIKDIGPPVLENLNNSEKNNKRRLIRLYEKLTNINAAKKSFIGIEKDFDVLKIGLTSERGIIRQRIKQRVIKRIKDGMIEESKNLLEKEILTYERMEELGLEYKYISKFLKKEIKTVDELVKMLSTKIGQFAKRQDTWFKKEKDVIWFDILDSDYNIKVEKKILDWYNSR